MRGSRYPSATSQNPLFARVYPRVCGGADLVGGQGDYSNGRGLSPRVRGSPVRGSSAVGLEFLGSIPACAGEPQAGSATWRCGDDRVYPRVCGGAIHCRMVMSDRGSRVYPRVCGGARITVLVHAAIHRRSIPACAGEPARLPSAMSSVDTGLSPRVRGSPLELVPDRQSSR